MNENEELEQAIEETKKLFIELGKALKKLLIPFAKQLEKTFCSFEHYQIYEMMHPRKKPRGSIRRKRKENKK